MTVRAALLARVSTEQQAQADRHSLPSQLADMTAWAEREGWEIVETYRIPGESAYRFYLEERPQFAQAIRDALAGKFEVLIVNDVTRFARTQAVLHSTLRDLKRAGVRVMVLTGEWDATDDPMLAGIYGAVAEAQSRQAGEKIRRAMRRRFEQGLPTGDIPFGYRSVGPDQPAAVVDAEAEAIRWAFGAFARGNGYLAIATEWNRRGLRPRSKRGLTAFTVSSVQSVIENRFYAGLITHRGEERPGAHQAIVSESAWLRAQRRVRRQSHGERSYGALLQGLAECDHCGGPLWTKPLGERPKAGPRRLYYWEPSRVRGRHCVAQGRTRSVAKVDSEIERAVLTMATDERWFRAAERMARSTDDAAAIARRRAELIAKRERVALAMLEGMLTPERCRQEQAKIDAELASLPIDARQVFTAGEALRSMGEAWEIADARARNELCRILFDGVRLDPLSEGIQLRSAPEFEQLLETRRAFVAIETKCPGTPDRGRAPLRTSGLYDLRELVVA